MTEADALKKWCPVWVTEPRVHEPDSQHNPMPNFSGDCVAKKCMMFRQAKKEDPASFYCGLSGSDGIL